MCADKARKLYLRENQSMKEFFQSPVRWMRESIKKESELEKPYLAGNYQSMHFKMPTPDWGSAVRVPTIRRRRIRRHSLPPFTFKNPLVPWWPLKMPEFNSWDTGCYYCILTCFDAGDCSYPISCRSSIACTYDQFGHGAEFGFNIEVHEGGIEEVVRPGDWGDSSILIYPDETLETHAYTVCMTDGLGHVCCSDVEKICDDCICGEEDTFTFDDASTADTVAPGSSIFVYVLGGCGDFSWSVAGTGFTLGSPTTTGRVNTLIAETGVACGTAFITITDDCGTVVTAEIRSTVGSWQYHSDCDLQWTGAWQSCGGAPEANAGGAESIVGRYKFLFPAGGAAVKCYCSSSTNGSGGYEWVVLFGAAGQCGNVPAGAANAQCTDNACTGGCIQTHGFFGNPSIQEWKC